LSVGGTIAKQSNNKAKAVKPDQPSDEEIKMAAYEMAVFLYDLYKKRKDSGSDVK